MFRRQDNSDDSSTNNPNKTAFKSDICLWLTTILKWYEKEQTDKKKNRVMED